MFCPQCKAEYRAGFTKCSDCDVDLVKELPVDPQPISETEHPQLVVVRTYPSHVEADLARTALEAAGIESMFGSDDQGGQSPGLAFTRGIALLVRSEDVEDADEILSVDDENNESTEFGSGVSVRRFFELSSAHNHVISNQTLYECETEFFQREM